MKKLFSYFSGKLNKDSEAALTEEELIKKLKSDKKQYIISAVICGVVLIFCYIFFTDTETGFIRYPKLFVEFIEKGYLVAGYFVFAVLLLIRDIVLAVLTHNALQKTEKEASSDAFNVLKNKERLKKILSTVLALVLPLFGAAELLTAEVLGEPVNAPGVYITLDEMGISGEQIANPYNGQRGRVWINRSLFADCLYSSEFIKTADGDMEILYQDIYIMKNNAMVESFTKALMENALFAESAESFTAFNTDGLDKAYICGETEGIAVKDNRICVITAAFSSEDDMKRALTAISEEWQK